MRIFFRKLGLAAVGVVAIGVAGNSFAGVSYSTAPAGVFAGTDGSGNAVVIESPASGNYAENSGADGDNNLQLGPTATGAEVAQTIVPTSTFTVTQLSILSGGKAGGSVTLHIYPVNTVVTGQGGSDTDGFVNTVFSTDLLGGGNGLAFTAFGSGGDQIINLALSGADQVQLTAGTEYALTFDLAADNATAFSWDRSSLDIYGSGNIYRNTSGVHGTDTQPGGAPQRDGFFALYGSVAAVPEPSSLCVIGLGGLAIARRRRA